MLHDKLDVLENQPLTVRGKERQTREGGKGEGRIHKIRQ